MKKKKNVFGPLFALDLEWLHSQTIPKIGFDSNINLNSIKFFFKDRDFVWNKDKISTYAFGFTWNVLEIVIICVTLWNYKKIALAQIYHGCLCSSVNHLNLQGLA